MSKIYKSKMKDENRLLGKIVNISLIALSIIFVLLFLKIIVTEISFHKRCCSLKSPPKIPISRRLLY